MFSFVLSDFRHNWLCQFVILCFLNFFDVFCHMALILVCFVVNFCHILPIFILQNGSEYI